MPTSWTSPTAVTQYTDSDIHVPWLHNSTSFINSTLDLTTPQYAINQLHSSKDLVYNSNTLVQDVNMKTYYLLFTGFHWANLPTSVSGIEAKQLQTWSSCNYVSTNNKYTKGKVNDYRRFKGSRKLHS